MDPKEQAHLEEDLAVMAHLLDKAVAESVGGQPEMAMGINLISGQPSRGSRAVYLEDYGALFTLHVGIPLVESKAAPGEKKEQSTADSSWEEAKRELYGPGPGGVIRGAPLEEFSPEKLNKLTDALVDALRNARNIRSLKTGDAVTVCVLGTAARPEPIAPDPAVGMLGGGTSGSYQGGTPPRGTVMTIRIKKADADAVGQESLKPEDFRKQAHIERYEGGPAGGPPGMFGGGRYGTMGGYGGYGGRY